MNKKTMKKVLEVLEFPIYLIKETKTGSIIDKVSVKDGEIKLESKYLTVANTQCTCLSWMKTRQCKHLKMLKADYTFLNGAEYDTVIPEMVRIAGVIEDDYPESASELRNTVKVLPNRIQFVKIELKTRKKGYNRIISIKGKKDKFAVVFDLV